MANDKNRDSNFSANQDDFDFSSLSTHEVESLLEAAKYALSKKLSERDSVVRNRFWDDIENAARKAGLSRHEIEQLR